MDRMQLQALVAKHGSKAAAARALGWPVTTFKDRLNAGESTLYEVEGPDGKPVMQWVKYPARGDKGLTHEEVLEAIREPLELLRGTSPEVLVPAPYGTVSDLATFYVLADQHLMMLSWAPETGENYDLRIGKQVLMDTTSRLIQRTPYSDQAVLLNLGDTLHVTDDSARTPMHRHELDTDGRFAKGLSVAAEVHVWMIDLLLQKHKSVLVRILPGNHDPYAALALTEALRMRYWNNPRVTVDRDPGLFFKWTFGKTMVLAHHGHTIKPQEFSGVAAAYWPKEWGATENRYAYFGHVHHRSKGGNEAYGLQWETFGTMAAKDSYARAHGFVSQRTMTAITLHKEWGEDSRQIEKVRNDG